MFTGLIQTLAHIDKVTPSNPNKPKSGIQITVTAQHITRPIELGESIALNGTCTTVIDFHDHSFTVELSPETLELTTFLQFKAGQSLNMERCLSLSDPLGGHIVTGHVDGKAVCIDKREEGNCWRYDFRLLTPEHASLLIPKGSIAIDGISLTVNTVLNHQFSVAIIPHTLEHTTLGTVEPDTLVNIECDMLGKYVQRFLQVSGSQSTSGQTEPNASNSTPSERSPASNRVPEAFFPHKMGNSNIHTGAWFNLERPPAD